MVSKMFSTMPIYTSPTSVTVPTGMIASTYEFGWLWIAVAEPWIAMAEPWMLYPWLSTGAVDAELLVKRWSMTCFTGKN